MSSFERVFVLGVDGPDGAGKTTAIDNLFLRELDVPEVPDADTPIGPFRVYDAQDGHALDLWVMRQVYPTWLPTGVAARRYLSGAPPLRLDHQQSLLHHDFEAGEVQQLAAASRAWRSWRAWCERMRPVGLGAPGALLIVCDRTPLSMLAYNGASILRVDRAQTPPRLPDVLKPDISTAYMVLRGTGLRVRLPHRVVLLTPPDDVLGQRLAAKQAAGTNVHAGSMGHNDNLEAAVARKVAFLQASAAPALRGLDHFDIVHPPGDVERLLDYTPWRMTSPADTTPNPTATQEESR